MRKNQHVAMVKSLRSEHKTARLAMAMAMIKSLKESIPVLLSSRTSSKPTPDYFELSEDMYLWTASLVLLNHLQETASLQGKRVLELGSGLGHLAVGLCR